VLLDILPIFEERPQDSTQLLERIDSWHTGGSKLDCPVPDFQFHRIAHLNAESAAEFSGKGDGMPAGDFGAVGLGLGWLAGFLWLGCGHSDTPHSGRMSMIRC
jgi:hypothetical protein